MTTEQQRIAIAKACGWIPELRRAEIPEAEFVHEETFWRRGNEVRRGPWLPDYLNDLNAMHDAVSSQAWDAAQMMAYVNALHSIVAPHYTVTAPLYVWCMTNATAAQRAEAFLRAIGKWSDE